MEHAPELAGGDAGALGPVERDLAGGIGDDLRGRETVHHRVGGLAGERLGDRAQQGVGQAAFLRRAGEGLTHIRLFEPDGGRIEQHAGAGVIQAQRGEQLDRAALHRGATQPAGEVRPRHGILEVVDAHRRDIPRARQRKRPGGLRIGRVEQARIGQILFPQHRAQVGAGDDVEAPRVQHRLDQLAVGGLHDLIQRIRLSLTPGRVEHAGLDMDLPHGEARLLHRGRLPRRGGLRADHQEDGKQTQDPGGDRAGGGVHGGPPGQPSSRGEGAAI